MSYQAIKAALIVQLDAGLAPLIGHPAQPQNIPRVAYYVLLDGFIRNEAAQIVTMTYTMLVRLAILLVNPETVEAQLDPYVNLVPNLISRDKTLGGLVKVGITLVPNGKAGYWDVAKQTYRIVDFSVAAMEKGPVSDGI